MTKVKMSLYVESILHQKLKLEAFKNKQSLTDFCNELLINGLNATDPKFVVESKIDAIPKNKNLSQLMIDRVLGYQDSNFILAILRTDQYQVQWIVIHEQPGLFLLRKESFETYGDHPVLNLQWSKEEWPAKPYWIEISKSAELIWSRSEEVRNEIQSKLNRWSAI
jgi:hypothetical protein